MYFSEKKSWNAKDMSMKNLMAFFFPQKGASTPVVVVSTPANQLSPEKRRERSHELMKLVSNSYRRMVSTLDKEANHIACIYYMLLRGMDTIEDDMTIPIEKKIPLLRNFHEIIFQRGWTFNENGPDEKHRQLLVEFDIIIEEFLSFSEEIRDIIADAAKDMGNGMADYILLREKSKYYVVTVEDYDKYCFHKLDIMKDFRNDFYQNRVYWPSAIWSQYVTNVSELMEPMNKELALNCQSAMTLNALSHVVDSLEFLSKLNNDPVMFKIIALSVATEFAYLTAIFRNYDVFSKKVTYQGIAKVISKCNNLEDFCILCKSNVKKIMKRNDPRDTKSYKKIDAVCKEVGSTDGVKDIFLCISVRGTMTK
ncbi:18553_t:CDS:2 [Acaulospora morrowiae]|uniref:18553_t:CDS:1 n=1 Tax=Acaulospora morrowiae TaxID=94023 RepID=A0A9N9C1K2_9GLOM|nr:18553_t:CDS:2 [Acaulospora morrowiae]